MWIEARLLQPGDLFHRVSEPLWLWRRVQKAKPGDRPHTTMVVGPDFVVNIPNRETVKLNTDSMDDSELAMRMLAS